MKKIYWIGGAWLALIIGAPILGAYNNQQDFANYKASPVCSKTNTFEPNASCRQIFTLPVVGFTWEKNKEPKYRDVIVKLPSGKERNISPKDEAFGQRLKSSDINQVEVEFWHGTPTLITQSKEAVQTTEHPDWSQDSVGHLIGFVMAALFLPIIIGAFVFVFFLGGRTVFRAISGKRA
jgi:hypothetical protein